MTIQTFPALRKQLQRHAPMLLIVLLFSSSVHAGFEECPQFFAQGKPPVVLPKPMQRELCYSAFATLHNGSTKTPVFVAHPSSTVNPQKSRFFLSDLNKINRLALTF